ncbi:nuclear transport factor 2 family protein [Actinomadura rubrisoli]|uniref:Nuclear transport factor 2 family protein n=1 Tax=Actinomadura rubrisoli TaxID=2530368 RepID=A0A4R4ZJQ2_9ACTN|nr:nuclear transport factor 2 family protein [Actinomadura rubrisoli]TDD58998.1 nuclear transport factor 2 family protein [Actinomadura rubrisoli]
MIDAEVRNALRDLVYRYASGLDRRRSDAIAGLFTEDGELVIHERDVPPRTYRGRAEIAEATATLDRFAMTHHLVGNHLPDLTGDPPTAETYCDARHVYETPQGPRVFVMVARYLDTFARDGDAWLFASRHVHVDWTEDRPLVQD